MLLQLQLAIDDELLAAQAARNASSTGAEIGRRLLDDAAQLLEAARRLGCRSRGYRGRRCSLPLKSMREGDALGHHRLRDRGAERHGRRIEGHGIVRAEARPWCRGTARGRATVRAIGPCTDCGEIEIVPRCRASRGRAKAAMPTTEQ